MCSVLHPDTRSIKLPKCDRTAGIDQSAKHTLGCYAAMYPGSFAVPNRFNR